MVYDTSSSSLWLGIISACTQKLNRKVIPTCFYICVIVFFSIDVSSSADAKSVREQLSLCSPEQSLQESEGPSAHDTFDQEPHGSSRRDRISQMSQDGVA